MIESRQYGGAASYVVVLHGRPGGAGEVEARARELGRRGHAVLEPIQTRRSVDGQVDELKSQIEGLCAPPIVDFDGAIHAAVWPEASELRETGSLVDAVSVIQCPVLAIHGDYDPRPSEGVRSPLQRVLPSAQFFELERCGHKPWQERYAKDEFYRLVENAIGRID